MGLNWGTVGGAAIGGLTGLGPAAVLGGAVLGTIAGQKRKSGPSYGSGPQFGIKSTEDFVKQDPNIQISREGVQSPDAISRRYSGLKEQSGQRVNASLGNNMNAIQRRFASQGAQGSGAQLKVEQMAQDQAVRQKEEAAAGIDAQEQQSLDQASGQAAQLNTAQAGMDFQNRVFSFDRASKMHELDLQERQQQIDSATTEFNKRVAGQQQRGGFLSNVIDSIF
jgi:hypothetical protein